MEQSFTMSLGRVDWVVRDMDDSAALLEIDADMTRFGEPDRMGDVIEPGALKNLVDLQERGLPVLWAHKMDNPIGKWGFIRIDGDRLKGTAVLHRKARRSEEIAALVQDDVVRGASIGFRSKDARLNDDMSGLIFRNITIYECSLVTVPAHQDAQVTAYRKALISDIVETNRQPERGASGLLNQFAWSKQ